MYPILPIVPFWGISISAIRLPGWFIEAYSMEDRFKQLANRQGVSEAWDAMAYDKINELVERVNALELRVAELEA